MLAKMNRSMFDALDDASLIWACVEPIIARMRGREHAVKESLYARLSASQRALMMFQVLRGHSSSGLEEFFRLVPYLPSHECIWQELQKAVKTFGDDAFAQLLREIEIEYQGNQGSNGDDILTKSSAYIQAAGEYDLLFRKAIAGADAIIAARIRSDWTEFVALQDE